MTTTLTTVIDPSRVSKTYNGATGCACGCRGTYARPGDVAFNKRIARMNREIASAEVFSFSDEDIYELESENGRVLRIYVDTL